MSKDSRLNRCTIKENRADIPLGCRGCPIETGLECNSCPANPRKEKSFGPKKSWFWEFYGDDACA